MKKMICVFMAIAMLCSLAAAEEFGPAGHEALFLEENVAVNVDMDGDGLEEEVLVRSEGVDEESYLVVCITGSDGSTTGYSTFLSYSTAIFIEDMNGDGKMELFLSGDAYSDDYYTWCMNYDAEEGILLLPFADSGREENTGDYYEYGYGKVDAVSGNEVVLTGSQDVLGTWMASRTFRLEENRFSFCDDGLWNMEKNLSNPEIWEYCSLILVKDLPVTLEDGSEAVLPAGEQFLVSRSDKISTVYFQTIGGLKGSFKIEPDVEYGWGSLIQGVSEDEWFEYVPYAD